MLDPKSLSYFSSVVQFQGFENAAKALGITQSAISQRLKQLELQVGHVLLERKPPCFPTAAGRQILVLFQQWQQLEHDALEELNSPLGDHWQRISIAVNVDAVNLWFMDALKPLFNEQKYLLDLRVDDQDNTHRLLEKGEVMACITSQAKPPQGCNSTFLGAMPYVAVASPQFISHYNKKNETQLNWLQKAPAATFGSKDELQRLWLSRELNRKVQFPTHLLPLNDQFRQLIVTGVAWGLLPLNECEQLIKQGDLVRLGAKSEYSVDLYWQIWNLRTQLNQQLTKSLIKTSQKVLLQIKNS